MPTKPVIVLDFSGVFFNNGSTVAFSAIQKKFGVAAAEMEEILNGAFALEYRTGVIEPDAFWKKVQAKTGVTDIAGLRQVFFDSYHVIPEMAAFVAELRAKGYRVGFLSDNPKDRSAYLQTKYHYVEQFDFGLFSHEAKVRKPSREIFEELVRRFNLNPAEVVFVDDRPKNLPPAQAVGMKTLHFTNLPTLKADLAALGITF